MIRQPPRSTLFPSTPLFRSQGKDEGIARRSTCQYLHFRREGDDCPAIPNLEQVGVSVTIEVCRDITERRSCRPARPRAEARPIEQNSPRCTTIHQHQAYDVV